VENLPGAAGYEEIFYEAVQPVIYTLLSSRTPPTSTCAIGGDDEEMAVLDSKFRVRGVAGLRVVDASAFPVVPGAFPSCPTMMLSVKAAEDIIAEAKAADARKA
jgi:choline dehydrogenase